MAKPGICVQRLVFLSVLAAVFLYTYLADFNIFGLVIKNLNTASELAGHFIALFLVLCFSALSVYYYFKRISNSQVSAKLLAWLKILSISFFIGFLISGLVIYLNIYSNKTFDI